MSTLKEKSVSAVFWSVSERFGLYGVKFILGIILARLLSPEAFGLVGMITVFFVVAEVFVKSGFNLAYVQKKEVKHADADTIFYTNLVISFLLYGILYSGAPIIAGFYEEPRLIELIRVMGLVIVINAFNIIQQAQLTRDVNFKKRAKVTVIATLMSGTAGVTAAYLGLGVWALVIQSMSNRTLIAVGFWISTDYIPKWQFSRQSFKEMFSFGFWQLLTSLIRKVFDNIYILTIGKFFSAGQLGFYTKAKQFQRMASENIAGPIGQVAFPVYSKLQDNKEQLRNAMSRFMRHTLFFILPLLLTLIIVAEPFVILLLKEKWAPMIPFLQLLCVVGLFFPIHTINQQALVAQGKIKLSFKIELLRNGLRLLNIFIAYRFGIIYIILGEVVVSFTALWIISGYNHKYVNYGFWKQFKDIWLILAGGILAAVFAYTIGNFIEELLFTLIINILIFSAIYFIFSYAFNRHLLFATIELTKNLAKNKF